MADDDKKIIIDEDWKSQVEREREQAVGAREQELPDAPGEGNEEEMTLFEALISGLSTQAMLALGLVAQPGEDQVMVDLGMAAHLIDTLSMLQEKTKGNLDERESEMIAEAASELRRAFTARAQQAEEASASGPGMNPNSPGGGGSMPGSPIIG